MLFVFSPHFRQYDNTIFIHYCIQQSCTQWNYIQNTSLDIGSGMLLKGALILKLLNNPSASCFLINFDFLAPHIAHFDNSL